MTQVSESTQTRSVLIVGTLIAAALVGLALLAVGKKSNTGDGSTANFVLKDEPFDGKEDAKVSVVVVEDFKCPACKAFQASAAQEIKTKYVDTGKIKLYTLIWPFISSQVAKNPEDDSTYAAQAAKCVYDLAGNKGFNTYKDILFRAQESETKVWATKAYLKELASNVEGVDSAKMATCLDTDATKDRVTADKKQVEAAGVNATPTLFVNGKKVASSGVADVSKEIDAALAK